MKIYGDANSGNCYKVKLVCELLSVDYNWIDMDILAGDTKKSEFIARNPNAKIPFVEFSNGFFLSESNAIVNYIANNSDLYPNDSKTQALIQQWQFFEQYSHEPNIAVARFINKYLGLPQSRLAEYESKQVGGLKALQVMEQALKQSPYLCGDTMTTADVTLFAYTHVADEGGFNLNAFPYIQNWITGIKQLNKFVALG